MDAEQKHAVLGQGVLDKSNTASGVWADIAHRRGKGNFARRLP
jgi:hypothetical protein